MEWLNYHHLLYFWTVAREGSIAKATTSLHLAPSTISLQIRALEEALDEKLFERKGRRLVLTEAATERAHGSSPGARRLVRRTGRKPLVVGEFDDTPPQGVRGSGLGLFTAPFSHRRRGAKAVSYHRDWWDD
jgi:hypothetical protein